MLYNINRISYKMNSPITKSSAAQLRACKAYHEKKSQDEEYKKSKAERARKYYNQNKDSVLQKQKLLRKKNSEQLEKLEKLLKDNNISIN